MISIKTQLELQAVLAINPNAEVEFWEGDFDISVGGSSTPLFKVHAGVSLRVVAWESSQPRVEAWGSSQPRVVAWGSSQPRVEARESSQPRVVAWESSQPCVVAWGFVQLSIFGKVVAKVSAHVAVQIEGAAEVEGGQQVRVERSTPQDWCDYYGVQVKKGIAILYKGVNGEFKTSREFAYVPGTTPIAPDWDGGEQECGGGLHFSPSPAMTREFEPDATKFIACPVALSEIAVHSNGVYPQKVKAPGCCGPVYEVDENGEPVANKEPIQKTK